MRDRRKKFIFGTRPKIFSSFLFLLMHVLHHAKIVVASKIPLISVGSGSVLLLFFSVVSHS